MPAPTDQEIQRQKEIREAERRGWLKGIQDAAGVAEGYVLSSGDHATEVAVEIRALGEKEE